MTNYLNLRIGAKSRLNILKKLSPINWRNARHATFKNHDELSQGYNTRFGEKIEILYSFSESFRREQFVDEIKNSHIKHTGWFCDLYQNEKCRGLVVALPHCKFLSGYELSDNGERVYFLDVFNDERDAIRNADREAESYSEVAREHSQKFYEASELQDKNESLFARLRECLALRNNPCFVRLRLEALEIIASIKENRDTLKDDYEGVL